MWLKAILLAAATVVPSALGFNITNYCAAPDMTPEQNRAYKAIASQIATMKRAGDTSLERRDQVDPYIVNVYVHVVAGGNSWDDGWVPRDKIVNQIEVLWIDFYYANFKFVLADVDYTINPTWAADLDGLNMKKKLRKGTYQDLNLYYIKNFQTSGTAGYCYYPIDNIVPGSDAWFLDGCTMNHDVIYGTPNSYEYNLGRVTVHEVGHWLGLKHTFEGGCDDADGMPDTPAEASAAFGCPTGRDTCPDKEGLDPVHNHMDYTYDRCKTDGFTSSQRWAMQLYWVAYRTGK